MPLSRRVFFQPLQFGVACRAGAEKIVHSLRNCIEEHWMQGEEESYLKWI